MDTWVKQAFDAIVIGSGPGGAAVARELSRHEKKVIILERGRADPIEGSLRQAARLALIPGQSLLFTEQLLALVRGLTVGGSSILAYATAFDPPYEMFDRYGIDLRGEVAQVKMELPLAVLSDDLVGPAAKWISRSALELGLPWEKLPKTVHQEKCRIECDKCTFGCPYGAKWTAREYIEEARWQGATLLTGARVTGLEIENNRVQSVRFKRDGHQKRVSAPLVILAAGGIGTPLILHASGIDNAGRNFFFDPLLIIYGFVDDLDGGAEFPMAAGFQDKSEGYILTDLMWPKAVYGIFTAEVMRFDRLPAQSRRLPIMVKAKDDLGGTIQPHGGVRKRLSEADRRRLSRGASVAREILQHAGARHIFSTYYVATHPGGTARINEVVDADLKTNLDNLFICDCSVIPEAWGLPPTLTILALGKRLGTHLASL